MRLTIIIAAIIIAIGIMLSNGIYVPMGQVTYLNTFTGKCFSFFDEKVSTVEENPFTRLLREEERKKRP